MNDSNVTHKQIFFRQYDPELIDPVNLTNLLFWLGRNVNIDKSYMFFFLYHHKRNLLCTYKYLQNSR